MLYGVARRLGSLHLSYSSLITIIPPNRRKPLLESESKYLENNLNLIYIHLRGLLDNFAWIFAYVTNPEKISNFNKMSIGIFNERYQENFLKCPSDALKEFQAWNDDLSERRNPVAHRIPLYLVPSILSPNDSESVSLHMKEAHKKALALDFQGFEDSFAKVRSVGSYSPVFAHNPKESLLNIYPTIPNDVGTLLSIQKILFEIIDNEEYLRKDVTTSS